MSINPPSNHALDRHGNAAHAVSRRLSEASDTCTVTCPDGRRYTFREHANHKAFDVSIDVDGYNVTRFVCSSRNWIARKLAWIAVSIVFICAALLCSGVIQF